LVLHLHIHILFASVNSKLLNFPLIAGVHEVEVDRLNHKVRVMGWITQEKILKTVRKTGKTAQLCLYPHNPVNQAFHPEYYYQYQGRPAHRKVFAGKVDSYNYHVHGYDNYQFPGYYHGVAPTQLVSDKTHYLFSDDNPKGCSIM
jgi:Heavy-metal-associated domain